MPKSKQTKRTSKSSTKPKQLPPPTPLPPGTVSISVGANTMHRQVGIFFGQPVTQLVFEATHARNLAQNILIQADLAEGKSRA